MAGGLTVFIGLLGIVFLWILSMKNIVKTSLTALLANNQHWRLKSIRIRWFNSNIFMGIFCLQTSSVANNQEIIISSAVSM